MARLTLLLTIISFAFVLVSCGNDTNSSSTPATPKAPSSKPPSVPGTGIVTKIIEAAEEIPKAFVTAGADTLEAIGSLFFPFG